MYKDNEKNKEAKRKWWNEHKKLEPKPLEPSKLEPLPQETDPHKILPPPIVEAIEHILLKRKELGLPDDSEQRWAAALSYQEKFGYRPYPWLTAQVCLTHINYVKAE